MVEMSCGSVIIEVMNTLKRYATTCAALMAVAIVLVGSTAMGASKAPSPPVIEPSLSYMVIIYSLVALAGICVIAFKNPKRT
jgi:hypothetical protein